MKNFKIEEKMPIINIGGIAFQELLERERKGKRTVEEISFDMERKIPFHERMEREKNYGRIIMMEGRPFMIIAALVNKPKDYVETEIPKLANQLDKYALNISTYKTKYKFDTPDVDEIIADAAYSRFYADLHNEGATYAHKWTSKGDEMYYGTGSSVSVWPTGADVSAPPADVPPGIVDRYRIKVQRMKVQRNVYTVNDGQAMGFEIGHSS